VEDGIYDQATVLVNGAPVWSNPARRRHGAQRWTRAGPRRTGRPRRWPTTWPRAPRFELTSDGGLQFGGWNIDD
jgi:hypothetical protein